MRAAAFFDRDGTINVNFGHVCRPEDLVFVPGVPELIKGYNDAGTPVIVVSNQAGIAKGLYTEQDMHRFNEYMNEQLRERYGAHVDAFYFCPHHPDKGYPEENPAYKIPCHCRKPDIGMLQSAAERFNIDLSASWVVGDTTVDIQTGVNAGAHTALVLTGDAGKDGKYPAAEPELVCGDLLQAVKKITGTEA